MINTFLFDLDGTLLPIDIELFIDIYLKEISVKLKDFIVPEKTAQYVWKATDFMVKNTDPKRTNMEVFSQFFSEISKTNFEDLSPVLDEFYRKEFLKTKQSSCPNPMVKEIIETLKEKNYDMVVATNPLFPKRAILHRLEWAGLKEEDFKLITSYENMHACKPHIEYYKEILYKIGKNPKECVMVGNDVQEDMVAKDLGITTFLLENQIIHRENTDPTYHYRGRYEDLKSMVINKF